MCLSVYCMCIAAGVQLVHQRAASHPARDDPARGARPAALHHLAARPQAARRQRLVGRRRRARRVGRRGRGRGQCRLLRV